MYYHKLERKILVLYWITDKINSFDMLNTQEKNNNNINNTSLDVTLIAHLSYESFFNRRKIKVNKF